MGAIPRLFRFLLFRILLLLLGGLSTVAGAATLIAYPAGGSVCANAWTGNLVVNGDAESGTTGWTVASGGQLTAWGYAVNNGWTKPAPTSGAYFFGSSGVANSVVSQDISLARTNGLNFSLSAKMGSYNNTDSAELKVIFKNNGGSEVGTFTTGTVTTNNIMLDKVVTGAIPNSAVTATIQMNMVRTSGGDADGFFDDITFKVQSSGYAGINTAIAAASAGDTIAACAGTYNEAVVISKGSLTITSLSGSRDVTINSSGVGINANTNLNPTGALTLSHLNIVAANNGISMNFVGTGTGGHVLSDLSIDNTSVSSDAITMGSDIRNCVTKFDNLIIKSKKSGIRADSMSCGTGVSAPAIPFSNLDISSGEYGIFVGSNSTGAHTFDNVKITATGANYPALALNYSGQRFDNITINSANAGISIANINSVAPVFSRLNIVAGASSGIFIGTGGTAGGDITIGSLAGRSSITANGTTNDATNSAIYIGTTLPAANKIVVSNIDLSTPNATGQGYGVYSQQSASSGAHTFSDVKFTGNKTSASTTGLWLSGGRRY